MILAPLRSVFGVRDLKSLEQKEENVTPAKRKDENPATKVARKKARGEKWKVMKEQRAKMLVLETPQR